MPKWNVAHQYKLNKSVNVQTSIFITAYQPNKNTKTCVLLTTKPEETTTAMQQQPKHDSAATNQHTTIWDGVFCPVHTGAT
jgi:hypothetical protein